MAEKLTKIGKYKILGQRGVGQAGTVYKALDLEIRREVAIKVLKTEYFGSQAVRSQANERFQREIRAIGKLSHPNIVQIFDSGLTQQQVPYLVMNFVEGRGLDVELAAEQCIEPNRALNILEQLALAIDYAHTQDVVHRDIKPSNILIDKHDHVHVVDFSTAILSDATLTPMGQVIGTPQYMAPEVIKGDRAGPAADFYSLAVVGYQLFTGKKPYRESGIAATFTSIVNDSPMSFKEQGCTLGVSIERVLRRGLAKNPDDRFNTASEFVLALREAFERSSMDLFSGDVEPQERKSASSSGSHKPGSLSLRSSAVRKRTVNLSMRKILMPTLALAALACGLGALLFFLVFDLRSNAAIATRGFLRVGYSPDEIAKLTNEDIIRVLSASMPDRTVLTALVELLKRDVTAATPTLLALTKSKSSNVRGEVLKAVLLFTAISERDKIEVFSAALNDNDRFLRVFAAFELIKLKGKSAVPLIQKRKGLEGDPMVTRVFDRIMAH